MTSSGRSALPFGQATLSPDDVGARVTVRWRLDDGRPTDVVGDLQILDDEVLAIRQRDGELVEVPRARLVAGRVVGPSMRSAREIEGITARSWPAPDTAWLGEWWLQAAGGFTFRANSVRPLGPPGCPLDEAIEKVGAWYAERGLPAQVRVVEGSDLDQQLVRRGWSEHYPTYLVTATVAAIRRRAGERAVAVELAEQPSTPWLAGFRGGTTPPVAVEILTAPSAVAFASVVGEPAGGSASALAIGRATAEGPWITLSAIEVAPVARRRGLARALIAALVEWGAERGATRVCLEVLADNQPALALYDSLGFAVHYRHNYRRAPGPN